MVNTSSLLEIGSSETTDINISIVERDKLREIITSITPILFIEAQKHLIFFISIKRKESESQTELEGLFNTISGFIVKLESIVSIKARALLSSLNTRVKV